MKGEKVLVTTPETALWASDALLRSELRYRRLFETARDGILILDAVTGAITDANPFMTELLGYSREDLMDKELWQIGLFREREVNQAAFRLLQEQGYIRYENQPLQTSDGERREVEFVSNVYREGERSVIQCNIRDITNRKRAADAQRLSETRYRRIFEAARDGILILDIDSGVIIAANPYIEELLGYETNELLGKELWQIGLLADTQTNASTLRSLQESGYIRHDDLPLQTRRDMPREVKFVGVVYVEGDRRVVQCNIRDITERKRVEKVQQIALARERHIAETLQRPLIAGVAEDTFPGLRVATVYAPASDEALVGGDFHDAFFLPDGRVALAVADTLGKGLFAAARTMQIKDVLRAFARETRPAPADVVARVNRFACGTRRFDDGDDGMFTCLALVFLDPTTGVGEAVFAGCEPPVLLRADSTAEYLPITDACLPLGIRAEETYTATPLRLSEGDTLILMTDGITEARAPKTAGRPKHAFLEIEGLVALAKQAHGQPTLSGMGDAILEGARAFAGGVLHDDACLLLARRTPQT